MATPIHDRVKPNTSVREALPEMARFSTALEILQLSVLSLLQPTVFGVRAFLEDGNGQIALIRHSYRAGWFLPGGGVNRHELAEHAAQRESREEAGLVSSAEPEFFGLYQQHVGWVTNIVAVYRLRDAMLDFKRSLEVRELIWTDPAKPPPNTSAGTLRRLAEFTGKAAKSNRW